jgi:hypothetical protein
MCGSDTVEEDVRLLRTLKYKEEGRATPGEER